MNTITVHQYFYHLAPEVNDFQDYSKLSDLFACGITFYRLINGDMYLPNVNPTEIRDKIISGKYPDRSKYRLFIPKSLKTFTNKAMNIDFKKRFQSASEMRHALEQINICNNWNESIISNGTYWSTTNKHGIFSIKKEKAGNNWSIEAKKGKTKKTIRNINPISVKNIDEKKQTK